MTAEHTPGEPVGDPVATPATDETLRKRILSTGKLLMLIIGLLGVVAAVVVWAYREFEPVAHAKDTAEFHHRELTEHKSASHPGTIEALHKFEVRVTRVEVEAEYSRRQVRYLVSEIQKIGERVGSNPAPPPKPPEEP